MRRIFTLALMACVLFLAAPAHADDTLCPMMTLKHSKELKLSKKQKAEIERIRDQMTEGMRALKMKASDDVRGVLTGKQEKKAEELGLECPMMKGGDCPMMRGRGRRGGDCPMRE